jgi:hypothetical protein
VKTTLNGYHGFGSNPQKLVINYQILLKSHFYFSIYSAGSNGVMIRHSPHNSAMEEENYQ